MANWQPSAVNDRRRMLVAGHLFLVVEDNGEGWWNWWVSMAEPGICAGERGVLDQGGEPSEEQAKDMALHATELIADYIRNALRGGRQ